MTQGLAVFVLGFGQELAGACHMHAHDLLEIVYYGRGRGRVRTGQGDEFPFGKDTVLMHPAGVAHDQYSEQASIDYCLLLDVRRFSPVAGLGRSVCPGILQEPRLRLEVTALCALRRARDTRQQYLCDLRVSALLLELLCAGDADAQRPQGVAEALAGAKRFMEENFDRIQSIGEVARRTGMGQDYFRHQFVRLSGIAPKNFLTQLRIEHSKELLARTPLPQKVIAGQCGFDNIRYLSTRFRHYCGMSPGEYRRRARGEA